MGTTHSPVPTTPERFFVSITTELRASFAWPDGEAYEDISRGTLKSGKEAEIMAV